MEISKAMVDCMQTLRRRLRSELGVDIRLSQGDSVAAMLAACLRSHDETTRHLGQRLAELSGLQNQPDNSRDSSRKVAEQAVVEAPDKPLASVSVPPSVQSGAGSVRIYRGQRIYA